MSLLLKAIEPFPEKWKCKQTDRRWQDVHNTRMNIEDVGDKLKPFTHYICVCFHNLPNSIYVIIIIY